MPNETDEREPGHVPELKAKLRYLLKNRGGEGTLAGRRRPIGQQQTLAEALGIHPSRVAEWNRYGVIRNLAEIAPKIAEIFACDEKSFRLDSYGIFVEKLDHRGIGWDALVTAADVAGTVVEYPPASGAFRHTAPPDVVTENEDLPSFRAGTYIAATLPIPEIERGAPPGRRHLCLFSADPTGYLNWVPRMSTSKAFRGLATISLSVGEVTVPAPGGELRIGSRASGDHDIVLVASTDPLPEHLHASLMRPVDGAALSDTLAALARWLVPRIASRHAAIVRRPYFVRTA